MLESSKTLLDPENRQENEKKARPNYLTRRTTQIAQRNQWK
jgi:hypothetical protein